MKDEGEQTAKFSFTRQGPLIHSELFSDTKDPCPVFDGEDWHIFGSGTCRKTRTLKILHAKSRDLIGSWRELPPASLLGITGRQMTAPGVVFDHSEKVFHMFVQTEFSHLGGKIEHLTSKDGDIFHFSETILNSISESDESAIYDPHPAEIFGEKYITYSGSRKVGQPDIFLLKSVSGTWNGPWERKGIILSHYEIPHHNQHENEDYEWGLEGSQLIELPDKKILLNAVCFLPEGKRGTRQRVFFAMAERPEGPFKTLGPVLPPSNTGWESGENGHATALIENGKLHLFYQARSAENKNDHWKLGLASARL